MKKLGILLGVVVILLGGIYFATKPPKEETTNLIAMNSDELKTKIDNKESFTVYVYSDTCSACLQFKPVLQAYLQNNNKEIFQLPTTTASESQAAHDILGENFQATPSIFTIQNGTIVDYSVGALSQEALDTYAKKNESFFHA